MEKVLKNYAEKFGASPAIDDRGNLMMDHEDKFIDISWQEFLKKLEATGNPIIIATEDSSAIA